ncbi:MAG TPA: radical SAM protein, partial [bacterium]|nr:radical SAM protein [bacterium]
ARIKRYNIKWLAQWRVDTVKKDIMNKIKESNVFVIGLGVESLDNTVLQSMNKKVNSDQILSALEIAYNNGVRTGSNIIIGDPAETFKSANESIDWTLKNSKYDFSLDFIMAIPDAPIYRNAVNNGIIKNELNHIKNNFPVINLTKMSDSEFNALRSKVAVINIMLKHKPLADVIDTKKISRSNNRNIYQFSVKCPLCSAISIYKYYIFSRKPITPVLCKTCYKVLKIKTAKAFPDDYNFFKSNFFYAGVLIYHSFLYRISFFRKIFFALKKIIDK